MKTVSSSINNLPKNVVKNIIQQEFLKPLKQQDVISDSQESCNNLQLILPCTGRPGTQITPKMKKQLKKYCLII